MKQRELSHPFSSLSFQWQPRGSADSKTRSPVLINILLTRTDTSQSVRPWELKTCKVCCVILEKTLVPVTTASIFFLCKMFFFANSSMSHYISVCLHDEWGGQRLTAEHDTGLYKVICCFGALSCKHQGELQLPYLPNYLKQQQLHSRTGIDSPPIQLNCKLKLLCLIISHSFWRGRMKHFHIFC